MKILRRILIESGPQLGEIACRASMPEPACQSQEACMLGTAAGAEGLHQPVSVFDTDPAGVMGRLVHDPGGRGCWLAICPGVAVLSPVMPLRGVSYTPSCRSP